MACILTRTVNAQLANGADMASLVTSRPSISRLNKSNIVPISLILFAVVAMGAAVVYLLGTSGVPSAGPSETIYETAPVTRGTVTNTVSGTGPITTPASVPLT